MTNILTETWSYESNTDNRAAVVPDGCRDILFKQNTSGNASATITPLAVSTYHVDIRKDTKLLGFRLAPGTTIHHEALSSFLQTQNLMDISIDNWLESFCCRKNSINEALEGLSSDLHDIKTIAGNLGVSIRTLQRHVTTETGEPPQFWKSLVRARRCARVIAQSASKPMSLADAAALFHYSDQAHMAREIQRWFRCTLLLH